MLKYNGKLKPVFRVLRNNMPDAERILWSKIKNDQSGVRFYRQKIIGNYIADFYCHKLKLVIGLDGRQHYNEEAIKKDKARDEFLKSLGLKVIRFGNMSIYENINGVTSTIYNIVQESLKELENKQKGIMKIVSEAILSETILLSQSEKSP